MVAQVAATGAGASVKAGIACAEDAAPVGATATAATDACFVSCTLKETDVRKPYTGQQHAWLWTTHS